MNHNGRRKKWTQKRRGGGAQRTHGEEVREGETETRAVGRRRKDDEMKNRGAQGR